jgi:hypothetical protein
VRHTLIDCECEKCRREKFEHMAVVIALVGLVTCAVIAWLLTVLR